MTHLTQRLAAPFTALSLITSLALILGAGCDRQAAQAPELAATPEKAQPVVNVYTHRHYDADKALFKKFEEETGIKVNVKKDKADKLIERGNRYRGITDLKHVDTENSNQKAD